MRWALISVLILALILVPFFLFEDYFNALAARFASGQGSTWYAAVAIGGLLASDAANLVVSDETRGEAVDED